MSPAIGGAAPRIVLQRRAAALPGGTRASTRLLRCRSPSPRRARRSSRPLRSRTAAECDSGGDQGVRQARVVVAELVLEPAPLLGCGGLVGCRELPDRALQ